DRKLGGILTESGPLRLGSRGGTGQADFVVIGVGINMTTRPEQFSPALRQTCIALASASDLCPTSPACTKIEEMLPLLVNALLTASQRLAKDREALLAEWRTFDYLQGKQLCYLWHEKEIPATGIGLAEDGQYIILDCHGVEHRVTAGDLNPVTTSQQ
ncbi:MAG: hypothetical protein D3905_00330, partial [Candidatus Electrothrix sp. AS4_5]|nr:hypothetical protein [Candidatus Electrothrix gigas]